LRQLPATAANLSMGAIPTGLADEYGLIQKPVRKLRNEAELIRLRDECLRQRQMRDEEERRTKALEKELSDMRTAMRRRSQG